METLLSPKQVAEALGVSESSLKRWCDKGIIETQRTPGGHRRISLPSIVKFIREGDVPIVKPDLLGLPKEITRKKTNIDTAADRMCEALVAGEEDLFRSFGWALYAHGTALHEIFDRGLAEAFHRIGDKWECHEVDAYQERRGTEITLRFLRELRSLQSRPEKDAPLAMGATFENDIYNIPLTMCELILREIGWKAELLGNNLPAESLVNAIARERPRLFFMSVSHVFDKRKFIEDFQKVSEKCQSMVVALVVGGRELEKDLRKNLVYTAHSDNMNHLASFGRQYLQEIYKSK
jgi:excisionase family DNA binding protein